MMNADGTGVEVFFPLVFPDPDPEAESHYWLYPEEKINYQYLALGWYDWSPNGDSLAVLSSDPYHFNSQILEVASGDGSGRSRVFVTPTGEIPVFRHGRTLATRTRVEHHRTNFGEIIGAPAWSYDGGRLAFLYHHKDYRQNEYDGCGNKAAGMYVCVVNADGSHLSGVALPSSSGWGGTGSFSWSPDGSSVLLTEVRESGSLMWNDRWVSDIGPDQSFRENVGEIYIVSIDVGTGNASEVVRGAYASWSPDGSRIAVLGKYDDGGYLATVAPDASDFRVLVNANEDGDLELAKD